MAESLLVWRRLPAVHIGLLVSAIALAMLAYVAWTPGDWRGGGALASAGALACAAAAMARPRAGERVAAAIERSTPVAYLLAPLIASATVAIVSERPGLIEHQWRWFALWLASIAVVPFVTGLRLNYSASARWISAHRWEIAIVVVLTAGAAVARFVRLDGLPLPFSGDESTFGLAGLTIIEDAVVRPFQFGVHGAPTLYIYYMGSIEKLFGDSVTSARASSALIGVGAIPITYLFFRSAFNLTIAICGTLFLAAFHFHLQFSRQAMPNILDPVFIPLVFLFTYRAMRDGRRIDYALAGLALGLSAYAWTSARLIPFEVAALVAWWMLAKRSMPLNWLQGGAVALAAALIAAAPLGWYSFQHQDEFSTRLNAVGIHRAPPGQPTWYESERARGRSGVEIYAGQFKDGFDTVLRTKDPSPFYGASTPLIGPGVLIPLLIGIAWSVWRVREPRYLLALVLFTAPIVVGGVLTVPLATLRAADGEFVSGASAARLLGVIPATALLVGIGADRFGRMAAAGASSLRALEPRTDLIALLSSVILVGLLAFASLVYYFRIYDSEGYSDERTLQTERLGEDVRRWVPAGTPIYLLRTDTFATDTLNVFHPALTWGLREHPIAFVNREGIVFDTENYLGNPLNVGRVAFLFVGNRLRDDLDDVMAACPGGTLQSAELADPGLARATYVVDAEYVGQPERHPCVPAAPPPLRRRSALP